MYVLGNNATRGQLLNHAKFEKVGKQANLFCTCILIVWQFSCFTFVSILTFLNCHPTLVEGNYSNGFVHSSFNSFLSPQLLAQYSVDFSETFQLLFP